VCNAHFNEESIQKAIWKSHKMEYLYKRSSLDKTGGKLLSLQMSASAMMIWQ